MLNIVYCVRPDVMRRLLCRFRLFRILRMAIYRNLSNKNVEQKKQNESSKEVNRELFHPINAKFGDKQCSGHFIDLGSEYSGSFYSAWWRHIQYSHICISELTVGFSQNRNHSNSKLKIKKHEDEEVT